MPPTRTESRKIEAAILVSSSWRSRPNHLALADTLGRAGIALQVVSSIDDALALIASHDNPAQAVLIDADVATGGDAPALLAEAVARIRRDRAEVAPIVVATLPSARVVLSVFRAGAADLIDLATADEAAVLASLDVAGRDHHGRARDRRRLAELRQIIDEFLRVLVKAERRSLELEDALAEERDADGSGDRDLAPQVLVVDDDAPVVDLLTEVLTHAGLEVHRAFSGEEALSLFQRVAKASHPIDLVLVDKNLPGMSGLDTIRELRREHAGLPCMLMTGFSSSDAAVRAADLGVVGYVTKPFDDVRELATRVKQAAERFAAERRERRFLARIKKKHAQFLERYRQIAADLDRRRE